MKRQPKAQRHPAGSTAAPSASPLAPLTPREEQVVNGLAASALAAVTDVIENDPAIRIVQQIHEERALHKGNVGAKAVTNQTPEQTLQMLELLVAGARESATGDFADPGCYRLALVRLAARAIDGVLVCDRLMAAEDMVVGDRQ